MSETVQRKPTAAQLRALRYAIDQGRIRIMAGPSSVPGRVRRDMHARMIEAGLIDHGSWGITREGYVAVARGDAFALPNVVVGDLLRYVSHPGCVVRVTEVRNDGREFGAVYVSTCGVCEHGLGSGDPNARREPRLDHMRPQTLAGERSDSWRTPAYLVEPVPAAEALHIEREIARTAEVYDATRAAYDAGVPGVGFPWALYRGTIRPAYLARWCPACAIDFWSVSGSSSDLNAAHRAYHARRKLQYGGLPATDQQAVDMIIDDRISWNEVPVLAREYLFSIGLHGGECVPACTSLTCYRKSVRLGEPDGSDFETFEQWRNGGEFPMWPEPERRPYVGSVMAPDLDDPTSVEFAAYPGRQLVAVVPA